MLGQFINALARNGGAFGGRSFAHNAILGLVWLAMATSGFVFTEPAPTDVLVLGLIVILPVAGLFRPSPLLAILLLLFAGVAASGLVSATLADDTGKAVTHTLVSLYLAGAAFMFAGFIAVNPAAHLRLILNGLTCAAVLVAASGIAGYFDAFPGAEMFTKFGRASGTFKDPNVYGPFLVPAFLYAIHTALGRSMTRVGFPLLLAGFLAFATFISFSRGAWMNLILALAAYMALSFLTAESNGRRQKIAFLALLGAAMIAGTVAGALQVEKISALVSERASVAQSYDVGPEGRFGGQEKASGLILQNPLGIGAGSFALSYHHEEPHNVYLSMPLNAGWAGAGLYLAAVALTLLLGLKQAFKRTPWQPLVLIAFSAFLANAAEGLIIDTDHWRHFYLLMGMIWGVASVPSIVLAKQRAPRLRNRQIVGSAA
jgi:hypothetical protein